jgi:hypothetical protein
LEGNSCLLSSGASDSPVRHWTTTVHVRCSIPFHTENSRPLVLWIGWHTGHCPVHTGQSGVPNRPLARPRVARRLRGRPLALATVGSPDNLVIFSRTPPSIPESSTFIGDQRGAPDTVQCTTGQSGAPDQSCCLAAHNQVFSNLFLFFSALFLTHRQIY